MHPCTLEGLILLTDTTTTGECCLTSFYFSLFQKERDIDEKYFTKDKILLEKKNKKRKKTNLLSFTRKTEISEVSFIGIADAFVFDS